MAAALKEYFTKLGHALTTHWQHWQVCIFSGWGIFGKIRSLHFHQPGLVVIFSAVFVLGMWSALQRPAWNNHSTAWLCPLSWKWPTNLSQNRIQMNLNVNCPQFSLKASLSQYLIRSQDADWWEQYSWALFKAMSHMLCIGYGRFLHPYITQPDWRKKQRKRSPAPTSNPGFPHSPWRTCG